MSFLHHRQVPGNEIMPRQKIHALLATWTGNQVMRPTVFAGQKSMPRCVIGRLRSQALFCICRAGNLVSESTWLSRPRDSRLSEMSGFSFLRYRASASREPRTRDHRNEVTSQSPWHGASGMKQAVLTDACDFGATPPRSAPMFINTSNCCFGPLG